MNESIAIYILQLLDMLKEKQSEIYSQKFEISDLKADVSYLERKSNHLSNDIVSMFAGAR